MLRQFFLLENSSLVATIIISIACMLFSGFAMTRLTKLIRLPDVTAYIVAGIIIGPYCLKLIPTGVIDGMDFLSDIALAFIAFSTGEFFKLSTLKKGGRKVVLITILEALIASIFVFFATYSLLHLEFAFCIVLAALASATAPASTMMTIRQTGARGDFVDTLLQVVALDDVVGLLEYSIAISIALTPSSGSGNDFRIIDVIRPLGLNLGIFAVGCILGFIMKLFISKKRSTDNRLIISIALLFTFCGICALLDISPLLGCMAMGTVYINLTDDYELFKQLNNFSPPILLLFFVKSGLSFKLDTLFSSSVSVGSMPLLIIGVIYFIARIIGKYTGAFLGCLTAHKPSSTRNYLGLALIPQAGVAIGLAALGARTLGGESGEALQTIILASSVLYELIGPGCAKLSLYLSKSYSVKSRNMVPVEDLIPEDIPKTEDKLIKSIGKIQKNVPAHMK